MKAYHKVVLYTIIMIPIAAYLDAVLIRGMSFSDYLYVCTFEMIIFNIGVIVGMKVLRKELGIDKPSKLRLLFRRIFKR